MNIDAAIVLELAFQELQEIVPGRVAGERGAHGVLDLVPGHGFVLRNDPNPDWPAEGDRRRRGAAKGQARSPRGRSQQELLAVSVRSFVPPLFVCASHRRPPSRLRLA